MTNLDILLPIKLRQQCYANIVVFSFHLWKNTTKFFEINASIIGGGPK
jgi:hypothetical protein